METKIKNGWCYVYRDKYLSQWSNIEQRELTREANKTIEGFVRENSEVAKVQSLAGLHPTLLADHFNNVLNALLILSNPDKQCDDQTINTYEPHHAHDGRISCKMQELAEYFRAPFI